MRQVVPHKMQHIAIFGAGLSGRAAYKRARQLGIGCVVHDDHLAMHEDIASADWQDWQSWDWQAVDALVLSPGIAHSFPAPHEVAVAAKSHGVEIISEVEFGLRTGQWGKLVVITGTNGKSTTTALTGHILKSAGLDVRVGGNLGTALCEMADNPDGVTILELSSYQLETSPSLAPDISALLNITPDHLDRHGGLAGYIEAKKIALRAVGSDGLCLLSDESEIMAGVRDWAKASLPAEILVVGTNDIAQIATDNAYLAGAHNKQNAAFATKIAQRCGVSEDDITSAIADFVGLDHRLQPVGARGDISFVNDSKATNGDASAKALGAYENIIWLAGGRAKADGLAACAPYFTHITRAHFYGECAAEFYEQAKDHMSCATHDTLDEAFDSATKSLPEAGVILLSPAAASFDQFPNFGARGSHFAALVSDYLAKDTSPSETGGQPC